MASEVGGSPGVPRGGLIAGAALLLFGFCIAGGCGVDERAPEVVKGSASERPADAGPGSASAAIDPEGDGGSGDAAVCPEGRCSLALGAACRASRECSSGACAATAAADNVCCAVSCGEAEVCADDGGSCVPAAACTTGEHRCSGSAYQRCANGRWALETACGDLGCNKDAGGCLLEVGAACDSTAACSEGACSPGPGGQRICCTAACAGPCRSCAASGAACEDLPDDDACGSVTCPPDTSCRDYAAGAPAGRCIAGRCGTGAELCPFTAISAGLACSDTSLCDDAGNCSVPKGVPGARCSAGDQCASGFCVDGLCCNQACNGLCETCEQTGQCRAAASDPNCPAVRCSSLAPQCANMTSDVLVPRCLSRGQCEGIQACQPDPASTPCMVGISVGLCDGAGRCMLAVDMGPTTSD